MKLGFDSYPSLLIFYLKNEKVSKDKDTNFIQATLLSDRQLAKTKEVKPRNHDDIEVL